jgi:hypothetical protein
MMNVIVTAGQTIQDIALQEYGALEAAIYILMDNNLGIDEALYGGQVINIRDQVPVLTENNKAIQRSLSASGVKPNRGTTPAPIPETNYFESGYIQSDYIE